MAWEWGCQDQEVEQNVRVSRLAHSTFQRIGDDVTVSSKGTDTLQANTSATCGVDNFSKRGVLKVLCLIFGC